MQSAKRTLCSFLDTFVLIFFALFASEGKIKEEHVGGSLAVVR